MVNFINDNEILKAHWYLEANQAPQVGLFCTSKQYMAWCPPTLPNSRQQLLCHGFPSLQYETRTDNVATDWWDLHKQIL